MHVEWRIDQEIHQPRSHFQQSPDDGIDEDKSANDDSCDDTTDEIPIWVRGEQRWISGITDETTCGQLVEALLRDDGMDVEQNDGLDQYVITERWRRVEQVLNGSTKVLKIWIAWGAAQSEVKLSLRRIESPQGTYHQPGGVNDDSGRESPTARPDSAILRRKRHRTSKTTTAWITQANTVHPTKSQKPTIEKLMKLILEQGETIQQQLSKLRDRELQIAKIEEARHRLREKEHGKNYLLETYLNGLHDADDKEEIGNGNSGNSDSGVHTSEDATTTPEVGISPVHGDEICDDFFDDKNGTMSVHTKRKSQSKRETKLLREHECSKEFLSMAHSTTLPEMHDDDIDADNISGQIEVLEQIVSINKRLQREEELLVRLSAKIRKYESDDPNLSETQIKAAIERVNSTIDKGFIEIQRMEHEFNVSDEMLEVKSDVINRLSEELYNLDLETADTDLQQPLALTTDTDQIHGHFADIMCTTSSNNHNSASNINSVRQQQITLQPPMFFRDHPHYNDATTQPHASLNIHPNNQISTAPYASDAVNKFIPPYRVSDQMIFTQAPNYFQKDDCGVPLVNLLQHIDQRNLNSPYAVHNVKVGPKKLLTGFGKDPDSDTGLSSMGEDCSQLGTLV
ncbi:uncharacterized protein LOC119077783 isoform X2 [Bradysia coprophila]|uniref:uncharacterized protein LOC119077783 isoform X2 n=1 Tax=Bradysia coprophila TaxID=38358 RepID=UPI00187DB5F9|nr:uncharacterized protein LOC119077783 isoform X2 [Bradysia coprophila]